jgi:hypothetical protein
MVVDVVIIWNNAFKRIDMVVVAVLVDVVVVGSTVVVVLVVVKLVVLVQVVHRSRSCSNSI